VCTTVGQFKRAQQRAEFEICQILKPDASLESHTGFDRSDERVLRIPGIPAEKIM
jgi:hypothetical protein